MRFFKDYKNLTDEFLSDFLGGIAKFRTEPQIYSLVCRAFCVVESKNSILRPFFHPN